MTEESQRYDMKFYSLKDKQIIEQSIDATPAEFASFLSGYLNYCDDMLVGFTKRSLNQDSLINDKIKSLKNEIRRMEQYLSEETLQEMALHDAGLV